MATLATEVSTYADVAKRMGSAGEGIAGIIEILNKSNPVLNDMLVREANDGAGHRTTVRTGIPQAAWRLLNYGVPRVKSTTAAVRDTSGMLEVYAECDKDLADLSGNAKAYRLSEASAIMEGMSQQMAETLFYGNTALNPERFLGIAPRYATGVEANAASAANVFNAGGADALNNTSAYLISWGETATHGIYPQGSTAGLRHRDLGEQTLVDDDGGQFQGYRDHFKWDLGLTVRDWRQNARVANIETDELDDLTKVKALLRAMIDAAEATPISGEDSNAGNTRRAWYVSKSVRSALRWGILENIAGNLTWENWMGKRVVMLDSIPVYRVDAILETEALVPFV
jgi:hypothetical protein